MKYRPLGHTGLSVSELSFGASPLGGVFGAVEENVAMETVHTALDLGINFFDVAPFYGLTRAETTLGRALRGVPRDRYLLSTKVGRYGMAEFDFSAERVMQSVEESLGRLQVDHVDLILCHDIEYVALNQVIDEAIPTLRKVIGQGKARFVGISGLPLKIYSDVLNQTALDAILSYCHYTLNDTTLAGLIPFLKQKGVGIINASSLAMGLLADRPLPEWHPAPDIMRQTVEQAAMHCRKLGTSLPQLAIQFALANQEIDTTLVGMSTPQEVRDNIAWLTTPVHAELLAEIQAILSPIRDMTWPSGLPENNA